jgi:peptide/nickel transport system ATP-binding protein/oligopeptide transport system ATP-binding protein
LLAAPAAQCYQLARMSPRPGPPLLDVQDLQIEFQQDGRTLRAVDGVSFSLQAGETLCLVGESGSGKSLTALSLARLVPAPPARYPAGRILLEGRDTLRMTPDELRAIRGKVISYVFQEPGAALHPTFRVGSQIRESLRLHRPEADSDDEVIRLLRLVGIPAPESRLRDYPHQLSGGMQQRVMIAMALASQPRLLVADEPTTALDVTVQAQIIELLAELQQTLGMSILLITHNLGIVADIADRVAVMYAGQIVENAPADELLRHPRHPYTRALLESVPRLGTHGDRLKTIGGAVPQLGAWPSGCRFHPRCPHAQPACQAQAPTLVEASPGRSVRCPVVKESMS